jgi:competence protein ComEC
VAIFVGGAVPRTAVDDWRAGRLLRAPVLLRRPARYLNHGLPDQERALARRGVSLVGTIKSAALVEVVDHGRWWEELAASVRARTRIALARHVGSHSEQSAAIATAILIGDRAGLSDDTEQRLQEAGTYHVIAISGGNIAILTGLLLWVLRAAGVRGRVAALVTIVGLVAYGVVAAGGPSVGRATLMAVIHLAVRLIDQRTPPMHAISLTASALLLFYPLQVVDVGFWFTFGATMALVTAASLVTSPREPRQTHPGDVTRRPVTATVLTSGGSALSSRLWLVLAGTACVELALAPIAGFVFQRVTLAGLALNFAALPAMTVVQLAGMGVVAADLTALPGLAAASGHVAHLAATALVNSAHLLDYAPWLTWRVPPPASGVMALYYTCLAIAVLAWRAGHPRCTKVAAACAAPLFLWIITAPDALVRSSGDGHLHVSMLDVGQGDCMLVTFPHGRRLMVDSGGLARSTFDIGDRVVGATLRATRLMWLDYLAVTHADNDHAGGAAALLRDFQPHEIWWGIRVANHAPTDAIRHDAERLGVAWRTVQRGDRIAIDGVDVLVHHPPLEDWQRQRVRNNDSMVLELRFRHVSVLLTGDIDRQVEAELALDLRPVVVLKAAHHGSLTSSSREFIRAVRPAVVMIGVGRGNLYGHPAPYVLGRLHDAGAEVFRTDLDGQITVTTDGDTVWTRTFTGRRHVVGRAD